MINSAPRLRRGLASLIALVLAVIILLAGIWWGGHPSNLPPPLRGGFFESRGLVLVNQALNVLTSRYYRRLNRSSLVSGALSGMVASLDDPYSDYLDPQALRERNQEPAQPQGGVGINTVAEPITQWMTRRRRPTRRSPWPNVPWPPSGERLADPAERHGWDPGDRGYRERRTPTEVVAWAT